MTPAPRDREPRLTNGSVFRIPWVLLVGFLLALMGAAYLRLDSVKADKELVASMASDIRELREFLMGKK